MATSIDEEENSTLLLSEISRFTSSKRPPGIVSRAKYILWIYSISITVLLILSFVSKPHSRAHHDKDFMLYSFGSDKRYQSLDHRYDDLWNILKFEESGFLQVANEETGQAELGSITMFHQLHCLASIRTALQKAYDGTPPGLDFHADRHWPHCLDYLVQTSLCLADPTVEHGIRVNGSTLISGTHDIRVCKRREPIIDLVHEHGTVSSRKNLQDFIDIGIL
ncbi:hypothetical protein F5884DRAFT_880842 [Xylogone sp. PMI_703]|nr:hypothetical protein F5884DRAFT_880842 [Xylogone sp. PMI_703]